jgi:excisionase family DNA binding protein
LSSPIWLTVKELARYINMKEKTLYYLVRNGSIPHYRVGKLVRFKKDEIDQWMDTKQVKLAKNHIDKIIRSLYTPNKGDQATSRRR